MSSAVDANRQTDVQTAMRLAEMRLKHFGVCRDILRKRARRLRFLSGSFRFLVIVFGLLIGARGGIELFLTKHRFEEVYKLYPMYLEIMFASLGFAIALIAALEQVFKYQEKANELAHLGVKALAHSMDFMARLEKPQLTSDAIWQIIKEENDALAILRDTAAKVGIEVAPATDEQFDRRLPPASTESRG